MARYCSGGRRTWPGLGSSRTGLSALAAHNIVRKVRDGSCTLVIPAKEDALQYLLEFLEMHHIDNVMVTLDEADIMPSECIMKADVEVGAENSQRQIFE